MKFQNKKVLLIGTGYMAQEYLKVLRHLEVACTVLARDPKKAKEVAQDYGYLGLGGGCEQLSKLNMGDYDLIINASSLESLKETTIQCLKSGAQKILLEKPGALSLTELKEMSCFAEGSCLKIAYNRRFYNSIRKLKNLILEEGGPLACLFDFTDREKDILNIVRPPEVVRRWGYVNSSHVIDASFFLIGLPRTMNCISSGSWEAHPSGTIFVGSGETTQCPFSYFATWNGGGRWNIEVSTKEGRYKLSPLEELQFCRKNQFAWEKINLPDEDDIHFKPGLKKMVTAMLQSNTDELPDLKDQIEMFKVLNQVFNYEN